MKQFALIILFLLFFSCKNTIQNEIELPISKILETELVDDIPYLVLINGIDSLYEIIIEGEVGVTQKGDTLRSYFNISDTIFSQLNSMMCCQNEYFYTNNLLKYEKEVSDYTEINNYHYSSHNQTIYKTRQSKSYIDTIAIYNILNNKINWKLNLNNNTEDTSFYFYKEGFLIKKITTDLSPLHKGNTKYISEFKRNENNSLIKAIYTSTNAIQILNFDKSGLPKESIFINYDSLQSDTICITKWTSPTSTM